MRPLSPLSNSWLPSVKVSKHTVFIIAASASPSAPARLKYSVPVSASPAWIFSTFGPAALAMSSMACVTRGKPAASTVTVAGVAPPVFSLSVRLLLSSVECWSLMCTRVRV